MKPHTLFRRAMLLSATVCAGLLSQPALSPAQAAEAFDGSKARVNLSSKLRMLTQTVGSASCRLSAGIDAEAAAADLATAQNEFNTILSGLEFGSPALGIPSAEKSRVVLKSLKEVHAKWDPIDEAVKTLISGAPGQARAADLIAGNNGALLDATMILTSDVSNEYSNPQELTQADAISMNIAGRQRMLVERISKEVCGMVDGVDQGATASLGQSLDMYTVSLNALRDGMLDAGINPPPNDAIRKELAAVQSTWNESKPILDAIRGGMQPSTENVAALASVSSGLVNDMNNVVTLYMLATPGQEDVYRVPLKAYAEEQLTKWLENPELIAAVKAQNAAHSGLTQADIDQLDLDWRAQRKEESKPLIDQLLNQPTSAWLRDQQAQTASFVTEVFAMDNHGLNVAQSVETSDYWQGDEAKWKETYGNG